MRSDIVDERDVAVENVAPTFRVTAHFLPSPSGSYSRVDTYDVVDADIFEVLDLVRSETFVDAGRIEIASKYFDANNDGVTVLLGVIERALS